MEIEFFRWRKKANYSGLQTLPRDSYQRRHFFNSIIHFRSSHFHCHTDGWPAKRAYSKHCFFFEHLIVTESGGDNFIFERERDYISRRSGILWQIFLARLLVRYLGTGSPPPDLLFSDSWSARPESSSSPMTDDEQVEDEDVVVRWLQLLVLPLVCREEVEDVVVAAGTLELWGARGRVLGTS